MRDQASTLRNLIHRHSVETPTAFCERARIITFTSGKGGVGKSNLALNLAVALAQLGKRVCLLDANSRTSNIDVLCGLNSYWNFNHVMTGAKTLGEVIQKGPAGINIVSGANGLLAIAKSPEFAESLAVFETAYDVLIIDTGTGSPESARRFANVADVTFLVTTPEPTAIAEAYAALKAWQGNVTLMPEVLVNRVASAEEAKQILERFQQTVEMFLRRPPPSGCWVVDDPAVAQAVAMRHPFVELVSETAAARDLIMIAKRLCAGAKPVRKQSLFERL